MFHHFMRPFLYIIFCWGNAGALNDNQLKNRYLVFKLCFYFYITGAYLNQKPKPILSDKLF